MNDDVVSTNVGNHATEQHVREDDPYLGDHAGRVELVKEAIPGGELGDQGVVSAHGHEGGGGEGESAAGEVETNQGAEKRGVEGF